MVNIMYVTVDDFLNYAYTMDIAEESMKPFDKILSKMEVIAAKILAVFQKFGNNLRRLGRYNIPKQIAADVKKLIGDLFDLYMKAFSAAVSGESTDVSSINLTVIQNSDAYINVMEGSIDDYEEDDIITVDSKKFVQSMNRATDNMKTAKIQIARDKRDPDIPKEKIEMYKLMLNAATTELKVIGKIFTFGKQKEKAVVTQ